MTMHDCNAPAMSVEGVAVFVSKKPLRWPATIRLPPDGLGEVTAEFGSLHLVCEGNNTSNHSRKGDFVVRGRGKIKGIAAEKILRIEDE